MGKAAGAVTAAAMLGGGVMTVLSGIIGGYAELAAVGMMGVTLLVAGQLFSRGAHAGEASGMHGKQPVNG